MLPHEKALVKRLETQPFALIGINSDGPADVLRKLLADNAIKWRQVVDESTTGRLATQWNVSSWPTIFVVDAKGVIRHRNLRDEDLEKAVVALLAELAPKK